jgi:hypothetical protein
LGSVSRIVWRAAARGGAESPLAEIHYASPSEFMTEFAPGLDSGSLFIRSDHPPAVGERREILLEIGFISRSFRLRGEVTEATTLGESRLNGRAPGFRLKLVEIDEVVRKEMKMLVTQLQKGLAFEAAKTLKGAAGERLPLEKQIRGMPTTLKVMLALKADREERNALAKDPDPQVLQFLLKNSKLGVDEIRSIAGRNTINHQHIMTIAGNTAWFSDDQVRLNLARNPHLPDLLVDQLLGAMSVAHLRIVAGAASTSAKARRVAHRLLYDKGL